MKALTIHAPWAWAIAAGHKRVENRVWSTSYRGPLAIHAGSSTTSDAAAESLMDQLGIIYPDWEPLRGRVLAVVDLVDVLDDTQPLLDDHRDTFGPWWQGPFGWVLENPRLVIPPVRCAGALRLWDVDLP